jgi:hypothetical protein
MVRSDVVEPIQRPPESAVSKRKPLHPSPSPTRLRRPIQSTVAPDGVRASW